ncbi:DUF2785 domain-containing protein [Planococcus beigongshangi]|uniref:DUF2785 domain-containing protein n=1 Tax=Planococcus beigongshangi TaxID=2782536 RepID=UPI00193B982F|nr:DUF2785 domain-containing protein [Planococcus beigongshangi]
MDKTEHVALLTAAELKEFLKKIHSGVEGWEEEKSEVIIASMLEHIGSSDSLLRDTYIYGTFCNLVLEKRLDESLLGEMLGACLTDKLLFHGIGEVDTDSVFTRSFTTLLIALILYSDNESHFLSAKTVSEVKEKLIVYLDAENDLRGFVPGKGWAHSIAHAADAFDELAKNPFADMEMQAELLGALWNKAFVSDSVYLHDEEERILVPILDMLNRELDFEIIESLLQKLPADILQQKEFLQEENYWFLMANAKKFLKSFYMQIEGKDELGKVQQTIKECLTAL